MLFIQHRIHESEEDTCSYESLEEASGGAVGGTNNSTKELTSVEFSLTEGAEYSEEKRAPVELPVMKIKPLFYEKQAPAEKPEVKFTNYLIKVFDEAV